jgi:hypothetical protein
MRVELAERRGVVDCLEGIAAIAAAQGQTDRAMRLFGVADSLRRELGAPLPAPTRQIYRPYLPPSNQPPQSWIDGQAMSLEQAVALALDRPAVGSGETRGASAASGG